MGHKETTAERFERDLLTLVARHYYALYRDLIEVLAPASTSKQGQQPFWICRS